MPGHKTTATAPLSQTSIFKGLILLLAIYNPETVALTLPSDNLISTPVHRRADNITIPTTSLPQKLSPVRWELAKSDQEIESFRQQNNLTLVTSEPTLAADHPGWPQALFQYVVFTPPIYYFDRRWPKSKPIFPWIIAGVGTAFWFTAFLRVQISALQKAAGWTSVLGWIPWCSLAVELHAWNAERLILLATVVMGAQWCLSLVTIFERWSGVGSIAYLVMSTNGCTPFQNDISSLQSGVRTRPFLIFQTVQFFLTSLYMLAYGNKYRKEPVDWIIQGKEQINRELAVFILVELIYSCVIATKGRPMIVSGNCLLVELDPRLGFYDSVIPADWKAITSFMGY